jgi:integrase
VGDLNAEAIDRYVQRRADEGAKPATINRETQLLGQALRLAVRRGNFARVPEIRRLREDNARQGFFEAAEYEVMVAHLPAHLRDLAAFAYLTGWRRGEILTLTWADVDRDSGIIRLRPENSKNRRGRVLAIEGELVPLLEQRWQARVVKDSQGIQHVVEWVFHRRGRPIVDFRKAWAAACAKAGFARPKLDDTGSPVLDSKGQPVMVPTKLVHDFRRTAARNLVRAGVPERVAMAVTGHLTRSMFDRYNIVAEDDLRSAMQRTAAYHRAASRTATVGALPTRTANAQ